VHGHGRWLCVVNRLEGVSRVGRWWSRVAGVDVSRWCVCVCVCMCVWPSPAFSEVRHCGTHISAAGPIVSSRSEMGSGGVNAFNSGALCVIVCACMRVWLCVWFVPCPACLTTSGTALCVPPSFCSAGAPPRLSCCSSCSAAAQASAERTPALHLSWCSAPCSALCSGPAWQSPSSTATGAPHLLSRAEPCCTHARLSSRLWSGGVRTQRGSVPSLR
jgi:hypothetical protein